MNVPTPTNNETSHDEIEKLFINNERLSQIEAFINRFNPIRVMKMEGMEIRHSAILAWLMDPLETHGLDDRFLKMFLAEALRDQGKTVKPTALDIFRSDLRDAEIRCEWQNIDIFILSQTNDWAFIIENKLHSKQGKGQLEGYMDKVHSIFESQEKPVIRGVFLTLGDEEPEDKRFAPIKYENICEILEQLLYQQSARLSSEVKTFLTHYLNILKDATGINSEQNEMEKLAKELYREHKNVLDFIIKHGASTDFVIAAHNLFGENPDRLKECRIGKYDYVFGGQLWNKGISFLPQSWYQELGGGDTTWPGCEKWLGGFPLFCWIEIFSLNDGAKGRLKIVAEVGPLSDIETRKKLIEAIGSASQSKNIRFQKNAAEAGRKGSRFLKNVTLNVKDMQDADEIERGIKTLLNKFEGEFEAIANVLPKFCETVRL